MKRVMALFDVHIPENIPLDGIIKFAKVWKPSHLILGGDFLHLEPVRELSKSKRFDVKSKEYNDAIFKLKEEFGIANEILSDLDKAVGSNCKKIFLQGNHEVWLDKILDKAPSQKEHFCPKANLLLEDRGYTWIPENRAYNVGRSYYIHGHYTNQYCAAKTLRVYQRNVFFGHGHSFQSMTDVSPLDSEPKCAMEVPCLCNKNPDYMRGRPVAWSHGFLCNYVDPDSSYFYPYLIKIINGTFVAPDGQLYTSQK